MEHQHQKHIRITEQIKKQIDPLKIVLPSYYGSLYADAARSLDLELKPSEVLDPKLINEKILQHVIMLATYTREAIEAIEGEDKITLQTVLAETKALREEIRELQEFIYEDTLTKSHNRKWFEDHYLQKDRVTFGVEGTMVAVDLNKFKQINDTYGHVVGDKVLVHIASKLKESGGDVIRFGGDEFLVLFGPESSAEGIRRRIEGMIDKCAKTSFKVDTRSFKVGFAYGISPFGIGEVMEEVIAKADKEMYSHKRSKRLDVIGDSCIVNDGGDI